MKVEFKYMKNYRALGYFMDVNPPGLVSRPRYFTLGLWWWRLSLVLEELP